MRNNKYRKTDRPQATNRRRHALNRSHEPVHVVKGDTVRVVRGDDKGKEGKVLHVYTKTGRVMVEGVNLAKRHRRARSAEEKSEIVEFAAPMHASNVMLIDPKSGSVTRVRVQKNDDGTKERISVRSGESIAAPKR
ncbi:MAG TPA: 50S ribosomal protein L24 [Gemmatimonadaceae bacterium]|jgi:large subunit ribosomal protein L24|nr:50S ribosomal protein L24 [Gemmatimonadaceae bacterium]